MQATPTIVAPLVDELEYGYARKMGAAGTLYRFNKPLRIKLGSDAAPLCVANRCNLELNAPDQIEYFEALDAKHKAFLAQVGPVACPHKGSPSDHAARYRPLLWTRERDGKRMLTVNAGDVTGIENGARVVVDAESCWLCYNGARAFATVRVTGVTAKK